MSSAQATSGPPAAPRPAAPVSVLLATPPLPCLVPDGVFDAFAWCASDTLEWRRPGPGRARPLERAHERQGEATPCVDWDATPCVDWDATPCVDGSDPARMVFVFRGPCDFLPRELARLHAIGLGLRDEEALAPWGIDEATDHLYARAVRPGELLWLAADNLNALFWGLHDWAHFHNHGPFERRAWTELQCDAAALAWLGWNRVAIGLDEATCDALVERVATLAHARFAAEAPPEKDPPSRAGVDAVLTRARQSLCSPA